MIEHTVIFYLSKDSRKSRQKEFARTAVRLHAKYGGSIYPVNSAAEIVQGLCIEDNITRLLFVMHGTPTTLGRPGKWGITTRKPNHKYTSLATLASAIKPRLANGASIGLCACLTGATPGTVSKWGVAAMVDGGNGSFGWELRNLLGVQVRTHIVSGHTTYCPMGRVFDPPVNSPGVSLAQMYCGSVITKQQRNTINAIVHGPLAEAWVSCDPRACDVIAKRIYAADIA